MSVYRLGELAPRIGPGGFIAPNAAVIGEVTLGANVGIWWAATLRGDIEPITIGDRSNIQDGSVVHTGRGAPTVVGRDCTIGHMVSLHGCTLSDRVLVGMGAIILNKAVIGEDCLIGAGALIAERKIIPPRSLVVGAPGRVVRELTDDEVATIGDMAGRYVRNAQRYAEGLAAV
ncbi:MAG: transferase hexapeptide repeat [Caulobacteraceae bacterium]|nr:transferase hexapeptide repeat [Caulobacteraceae bacterium]